jgi:N-acetylmuramoyl-L-alanine amidase
MTDKILAFISLCFGALFVTTNTEGAHSPDNYSTYVNQRDLDVLARTIWGEAWIDGYDGMQAVANVIMNRYEKGRSNSAYASRWGRTVAEVCQKPWQFSVWNENDPSRERILNVDISNDYFVQALNIAELALNGRLNDITGGADHYHADYVAPYWRDAMNRTTTVKTHLFYKEVA